MSIVARRTGKVAFHSHERARFAQDYHRGICNIFMGRAWSSFSYKYTYFLLRYEFHSGTTNDYPTVIINPCKSNPAVSLLILEKVLKTYY